MGNEAIAAVRAQGTEEAAATLQAAFAHHKAGRFDDADVLYREVLSTVPNHPNALHWLGVIETQRGHAERGVELIRRAFPALDNIYETHLDLGNALRLTGKREEALESFRRAIALKPDQATAYIWMGSVLGELGRFEAAVSHCQTALAIDPKSLSARMTLASVLHGARRMPEAAQAWREIIDLEPERAESYHQFSGQLITAGLLMEALHCQERAIALQPENALFHCARGQTLLRLYDAERAEASFRRALAIRQDCKEGLTGLSWALRMLGRFEEAEVYTKRLRELDPADCQAVRHVPSTGNQPQDTTEIVRLAGVLEGSQNKPNDRIAAGFALGRLLDEAGRYDEAFARYVTANALVREFWPASGDRFDATTFTRSIDALIASNSPENLADAVVTGNISELPVFVVGMPRSGTTLVEQICASHSRVFGAGERDDIASIAVDIARERKRGLPLSEVSRRAADAHIVKLHRLGRGALRVIDKLPDNIIVVALIARLFPRARIVYCSRDPRDISLSCYFQMFIEGAQHFSYDLADCGKRCRQIERLAAHWLKLLPHHMIEVSYEKLVADLEGESRRLIDFLGLSWEPSCLEFHRTERTVATISHWQVRQPLYSSSIGRWRHYEKHLGPLFAALDNRGETTVSETAGSLSA